MSDVPAKVDSKYELLLSAKKIFAEKGFEGATVKDLADDAGVNVSLVSYHFGGKEGLYRACVLQFAEARIDAIERILKSPNSTSELSIRLRLFAEEFVDIHIREPNLCKIVHRDVERMTAIGQEVFRQGFLPLFEKFVEFLKSAERMRLIRKFKDMEVPAALIFGSLIHVLNSEHIRIAMGRPSISDPKYREAVLSTWTELTIMSLSMTKSNSNKTQE